ncbi:hypothetical protein B0H14DRAFT_2626140 [Mycena olivaceomarginata]|nr:hypothetical protein B0H14DRAFT_2626140 [Mycena olivaceomarginata]
MKEFPQELIDRVLDLFVTPDLVHSPFVAGPREIGDLGLILLVDKAEMGLFSQSFNLLCLSIHVHEDGDSSLQSLVSILGTTIPTISWLILSFRTLSSSGIVEVMTCFPGLKELGLNGNDIQTSDDAIPSCRLPRKWGYMLARNDRAV